MTYDELKIKVGESGIKEWYDQRHLLLQNVNTSFKLELTGLVAIYKYVVDQLAGFNEYKELPAEIAEQKRNFEVSKERIEGLVTRDQKDDYNWDEAVRMLREQSRLFTATDPITQFLIQLYLTKKNNYQGAYDFLTGNTNNVTNKNYWLGYMMAYEFISKENSDLVRRSGIEKKSLGQLKSKFEQQLAESENQLADYIKRIDESFEKHAEKITSYKEEAEKSFTDWYEKTIAENKNFHDSATKKLANLELLYQEKIKLEAPANYWRTRAIKLTKQAYIWLICLIVALSAVVFILMLVLQQFENDKIQQLFSSTGLAIKWSIILITTISFLAFAVRTFAKLTFSAFHLSRDAEEREQLTFVYLALQKETKIDPTERHLIMQSIFSRVDTGLLKDDGGPTMPGNFMEQAKNIAGGK